MAMAHISSAFMHAELPMEGEVDIRSSGEMPSDSRQGACAHEVPYHDWVTWKVHKAMKGLRQSPRPFQDHLAHPDDLTLAGPVTNMKKTLGALHRALHANDWVAYTTW